MLYVICSGCLLKRFTDVIVCILHIILCSYLSEKLSTFLDSQTLQLLFRTLHVSFYLSCECLALKSHGIPDAVMTK